MQLVQNWKKHLRSTARRTILFETLRRYLFSETSQRSETPRERGKPIREISSRIVERLFDFEGVIVHCAGGRGRTGSVLGMVLTTLGFTANESIYFLDQTHKARGKAGWRRSAMAKTGRRKEPTKQSMKTKKYLYEKQKQWALRHGISMKGREENSAEVNYVNDESTNFFGGLSSESRNELEAADGGELKRTEAKAAKIDAVHSSSALGINVFQFWRNKPEKSRVAELCGFFQKGSHVCESLEFEKKFPIKSVGSSPNLDVVFRTKTGPTKIFAIESKFCEPFSSRNPAKENEYGLKEAYFAEKTDWRKLDNLKAHAKACLRVSDSKYRHLHAAQLIKHIMGLRDTGESFRLHYLYMDGLGEEGQIHAREVDEFRAVCEADRVTFRAISYQDLIIDLAKEFREEFAEYSDYITGRYL